MNHPLAPSRGKLENVVFVQMTSYSFDDFFYVEENFVVCETDEFDFEFLEGF
jgi:hypothetical protein